MDKNISNAKEVPVSLTEQMVLNPAALPGPVRTWRFYRIEYGGPNECCFREDSILLPPRADSYIFDLLFDFWQATGKSRRKILHKIIMEMERGLSHG